MIRYSGGTVQGEVPMTVQGEGAALRVPLRPPVRRGFCPLVVRAFILPGNTSAGGFRSRHPRAAGGMR